MGIAKAATGRAAALLLLTALAAPGARAAESVLRMKDGSEIRGEILSEDGESVVVKLRFGSITYRRSEIESIERGKDAPAGAGAGAAGAAEWRDVVVLKSGDEHRGLIVSEADDGIVFDLVMSGKDVSKTLTMRINIPAAKVDEVRKLTADKRAAARKYIEAAKREEAQDARGEQDLLVDRAFWDSKDGKERIPARKVELEHFVVEANTDEDFLRKAAYRLGKVFDAYKRHFGVDRNEARKVRVVIFNSMEEYYAAIGQAIKNPAFYAPDLKLVAAGCDMAKYRALIDSIREHHARLTKRLEEEQARIDKARADVRAIIDKYHRQLHTAGATTPQGRAIMEAIRRAERRWQIEVMKYEKPLKDIKEEIRELNARNERVFDEYADRMLRTLYHEGFHAFLDQFLFEEALVKHVPRWLNEGLAQYFENSRVEGARLILGQEDRRRMIFLRQARRDGKIVPMKQMLTAGPEDYLVEDMDDVEKSTKHYLQAWCLVHLLGETGALEKGNLHGFVRALAGGKAPMDALPALTGMPNAKLKGLWEARLGSSITSGE